MWLTLGTFWESRWWIDGFLVLLPPSYSRTVAHLHIWWWWYTAFTCIRIRIRSRSWCWDVPLKRRFSGSEFFSVNVKRFVGGVGSHGGGFWQEVVGDERRGARVFILKRVVTKFIHSEQRTTVSEGQRKAVYSDSASIWNISIKALLFSFSHVHS